MSTPTDSRPELITVIAYMRAKAGKEQELRDALVGDTPHLQDFGNRLEDLLDGPLNVHQMRRIA
jgi:hypothetical protein